jgi:hypothetical protein
MVVLLPCHSAKYNYKKKAKGRSLLLLLQPSPLRQLDKQSTFIYAERCPRDIWYSWHVTSSYNIYKVLSVLIKFFATRDTLKLWTWRIIVHTSVYIPYPGDAQDVVLYMWAWLEMGDMNCIHSLVAADEKFRRRLDERSFLLDKRFSFVWCVTTSILSSQKLRIIFHWLKLEILLFC